MARLLATLVASALLVNAAAADQPTTGNPKLQSIESITFAPDGMLIIGDGRGAQVVTVHTGDLKPITWGKLDAGDIKQKVGSLLGTDAKGVEILKLVVNPASQRAYLAVRKLSSKQDLILTVDGQGKISEFPLEKVKYQSFKLPADDKSPVVKITDITFADGR